MSAEGAYTPWMLQRRSVPRDLQPAYDIAVASGWQVLPIGSGHLKWVPPEGDYIVTARTPSDSRAIQNARSHLRRAGLKLPR